MKFLGNCTVINPTKVQVGLVHNMPFDPVHGLKKTQAELEAMGYLVEDNALPQPNPPVDYDPAGLFIDPTTGLVFYEYAPHQLTPEEQTAQLEAQNAAMLKVLVNNGLM